MFNNGDKVMWISQSQGFTTKKIGRIAFVVPANVAVNRIVPPKMAIKYTLAFQYDFGIRNHESYVVQVGNKLYWPLVKNLKLYKGEDHGTDQS